MVVMAALITAGAYTLAALGKNAQMPARIIPFLVAILVAVGAILKVVAGIIGDRDRTANETASWRASRATK